LLRRGPLFFFERGSFYSSFFLCFLRGNLFLFGGVFFFEGVFFLCLDTPWLDLAAQHPFKSSRIPSECIPTQSFLAARAKTDDHFLEAARWVGRVPSSPFTSPSQPRPFPSPGRSTFCEVPPLAPVPAPAGPVPPFLTENTTGLVTSLTAPSRYSFLFLP